MSRLSEAANNGHKDVVEFLVCKDANIHQKDNYNWNALLWGIYDSN